MSKNQLSKANPESSAHFIFRNICAVVTVFIAIYFLYQFLAIDMQSHNQDQFTNSIADAYEAKVAQTGVTVHFVDEGVDTGPIIRQERVAIDPSWDLETLESHVHAMEYDLFWQVIEQVAKSIEEEK